MKTKTNYKVIKKIDMFNLNQNTFKNASAIINALAQHLLSSVLYYEIVLQSKIFANYFLIQKENFDIICHAAFAA